jgi:hypothetical protein
MMGFTRPGQAQESLLEEVEKEVKYSAEQRIKDRQDIMAPPVLAGANAWEQGKAIRSKLDTGAASRSVLEFRAQR